MRCIFCKDVSDASKSLEHIIPESLGNLEHVLPPGVVCDSCNNYFSRKVEKPFIDSPSIIHIRHRQGIVNKRNLVPPISALYLEAGIEVCMADSAIYPRKDNEADLFIRTILNQEKGTLIVPVYPAEPLPNTTSRFLCKVALEALAYRFLRVVAELDELVDKIELDPLRNYARYGDNRGSIWEFNKRSLYDEDAVFSDGDSHYQVIHEFTFLQTDAEETIFVLALFGVEFAVSIDRPSIVGYSQWLLKNGNMSPLYP